MIAPSTTTLNSLQIVRGVAALSVVYLHLETPFRFGGFGVDLFFVLSGFVISMVIKNRQSADAFIISRFTRIFPLYFILTAVTFGVLFIKANYSLTIDYNFTNFFKSVLFIPYLNSLSQVTPIYGIGWTLNFEMIFYSFTAFVLILGAKWERLNLSVALFLLMVGAFCLGHLVSERHALMLLFKSPLLFEFLFGAIAYEIVSRFKGNEQQNKLLYMVLIAFLFGVMIYAERNYIEYRAITLGIPAFFIVIMAVKLESEVNSLPLRVKNTLITLGDASYSIYLLNMFIVNLMAKIMTKYFSFLAPSGLFGGILCFALCTIGGVWLHKFVDMPMVSWVRGQVKSLRGFNSPKRV